MRVYRAVEDVLKFLAFLSNVLICDRCAYGTPYKDRYYANHFGLYCSIESEIDFESRKIALNWLRQFELHAAMTENTENIIKLFRDTVVNLMIESGYSIIKLNSLKKNSVRILLDLRIVTMFYKTRQKEKQTFPVLLENI